MTFPFAARTNAPNTRAASMEPLEVLLSTHNPQVDKLLGGGFPCKGFVELLTTGERRSERLLRVMPALRKAVGKDQCQPPRKRGHMA